MKIVLAVLVLLAALAVVHAGDPAFCSQYTVTDVEITGLNCYLRAENINRASDLGTLQAPIFQANCQRAFGATQATFNFQSISTATTPATQYTRRTQTLYTFTPDEEKSTQVLPTPITEVFGAFPSGYILKATHEYTSTGGTTETCDLYLQFYAGQQQQDPIECNKLTITDITIPGLQCNRPLTGLNLVQSNSFEYDHNFATCVIPDEQTELSLSYAFTQRDGVVVTYTEHYIYNDAIGSDYYTGTGSDPAIWPFPPPAVRPGYFDFGTNFNVDLNGVPNTCFNEYRFTLQLASESSPPLSDSCTVKTQQECINHFQNNTACIYDFTAETCSLTATDICQGSNSESTCTANNCLWDPYLQNCLTTLSQINSVYACNYWNQYQTNSGNAACSFHACLYDQNAKKCLNSNETLSEPVIEVVSVNAQFVNSNVDTTNLTLNVQAIVPFVYTDATPTKPRFSQFQVLTSVSDYSVYGTEDKGVCSSYQALDPVEPLAFSVIADPALVNAYLINWFNTNNNFEFDDSADGELARRIFGKVRVGPNELVQAVTYDGVNLSFNLTVKLPTAVAECQGRGASYSDSNGNRLYNIPLSYIEVSPGPNYNQLVQNFAITIPTSGIATVGTSSSYGFNAFPIGVTVFKGESRGCLADEARLSIKFRLESYSVFDTSVRVGALSLSSVLLRSPDSPPGPVTCYGDFVAEATTVVCDYDIGVCTNTLTATTACRTLRADGNTFRACEYAKDEDRIADLGSDIPYDTDLDGLHQFFVTRSICPLDQGDISQCPTTSTRVGLPERVSAKILPLVFTDESRTTEDFQVESGFLPSTGSAIENKITGTVGEDGILNYVVGQSGVITIYAAMQPEVRNQFDLRANTADGQIRVIPYSATGQLLSTVQGYTGPAELFYGQFRARLLASAKEDYYAGCGAAGSCKMLPACDGIKGCDGFAIPVSQLRILMPASSYQIVMPYRIGLLNNDGSTPIARRRLLQTTEPVTRIGTATFRFIIDSTGRPVIVDNANTNSTQVTVDLISAIGAPDHDKARLSFYMTSLTIIPLSVIYYVVTAQLSKYCSSQK